MEYALITGASSGIGLALAHIMASKGHHLILVARNEPVLLNLKGQLEDKHQVAVEVIATDLSAPAQAEELYLQCKARGLSVNCLVNNAGFGEYGRFDPKKAAVYSNMLSLNITALTELTAHFLGDMKQRGAGRIMNVGSIAAFQPNPGLAVYGASKAYVMQFTEALSYELRGSGVSVTLLSPGVTETPFLSRADMQSAANTKNGVMQSHEVAQAGYEAMMAGKLNSTPGWRNKITTFGSKIMPSREILLRTAARILKDTRH